MTASTGEKKTGKIDTLMEKASRALAETDYFACERRCLEALRLAHGAEDYERMARILLPLQEARRQKRLAALDVGDVHVLSELPDEDELKIEPGCWLIEPPLVGADGRRLRERADREQIPVLVVVHEPMTQLRRWPIVMIGPVTVRAYVAPPEEVTPEWMIEANEALGDEAIAEVDSELPAATRVDRLMDRLGAVPEHEKLHQALEAACHAALREAAEQ